jgi:lipoprotein-anchoring transpeptidase ErfK/SrfK
MREAGRRTPDSSRRRPRIAAALVAAFVVLAGALAAVVLVSGGDGPSRAARAPTRARPTVTTAVVTTPPQPPPLRGAATNGSDIAVFAAPDSAAAPVDMLSAKTSYLLPRTLLAFDQQRDWLRVYLPTRPNNSTGWIRAADVVVSAPLEWRVRVSLAEHHLWLLHNGVVEFDTGVAIGTPQYPTPTGLFYVTDPIDLHDRPNLGYGVFAIGLSGHSDVLTEFGGGDGQIAIHGTNNPGDIGNDVSHGCVRVTNDAIERLSQLPLGTPVEIV